MSGISGVSSLVFIWLTSIVISRSEVTSQGFSNYSTTLRSISRCDIRIQLLNGRVRVGGQGNLIRFICLSNYQMLGESTALCENGKWSKPAPVCVKGGCQIPPNPNNGTLTTLAGNGAMIFNCDYGFSLNGSHVLICDGKTWNGTVPECVEIQSISPEIQFPTSTEAPTSNFACLTSEKQLNSYPKTTTEYRVPSTSETSGDQTKESDISTTTDVTNTPRSRADIPITDSSDENEEFQSTIPPEVDSTVNTIDWEGLVLAVSCIIGSVILLVVIGTIVKYYLRQNEISYARQPDSSAHSLSFHEGSEELGWIDNSRGGMTKF